MEFEDSNESTFETQAWIGISLTFAMGGRATVRGMVLMEVGTDANGVRTKAMKERKRFLNLKKGVISGWFLNYMYVKR